ncbi:hypothetical protein D3C86_1588320 [compost metagenome]
MSLLLDLLSLVSGKAKGRRKRLRNLNKHPAFKILDFFQDDPANTLRFTHTDQHALVESQVVGGDLIAVHGGVKLLHPLQFVSKLVFNPCQEVVVSHLWLASRFTLCVDELAQLDAAHCPRYVFIGRKTWRPRQSLIAHSI